MPHYLIHEPRRRARDLWRQSCGCGMDAWPCPVKVILDRQAEMMREVNARHPWRAA